jgi:UDP-3-O-[3-hydroxymyristoyl] glucosamine N-acyltransferase
MATNLWAKFRRLLPGDPLLVVEVAAVNADGTSTVVTPAGGAMRVIGTSVPVGQKAYIKGGAIIDKAPTLTHYEIEV